MQQDYDTTGRQAWTPERIASVVRIVFFVIIGGIALGVFATVTNVYYVGFVVAAAVLILLVAWHFEAALAIYAFVAFIPWGETPDLAVGGLGVGRGIFVSEVMLGFLLVIWFVRYMLKALPARRITSGFYIPIALYLAYSILNVVSSYLFWDPHVNRIYQHPLVNIAELGLRFLSAGALVMMATSVSNARWIRYITISICVVGLYNTLNAITGTKIPVIAPWWALIALMPACCFAAVALSNSYTKAKRLGAAAIVAIICYGVLYQSIAWVSGWIGLIVSIGVVALLTNRRAFLIGLVLVAIVCVFQWSFIDQSVFGRSEQDGDYERFDLMRGAWKYATTFPLGVGIGNYRTYNSFHYGQTWGTASLTSAHGTYSQHLAEMGIIGLALLLAILISGFRWLLQCYRKMADGPPKIFLIAAMGQLAGISCSAIIGDYIIPTYHNGGLTTFSTTVYSWLIWGLAIAYVRISSEEKPAK